MSKRKTEVAKAGHRRREAKRQKKNYQANRVQVNAKKAPLLAAGVPGVDIDTHHTNPARGDRHVSKIMGRSPKRVARELEKTEPLGKRDHSKRHTA